MADSIKLRGVNLGGWLVLEQWMTPSVFTGTTATDEFQLVSKLGRDAADILTMHRDLFITEADFKWIAERGLNAIRLPIGYWIFGKAKPYIGGIEYVDQALVWAEQYGLQVILDIHGAPGSQNGHDHSGQAGKILWGDDDTVEQTITFLEKLVERYSGVPALRGIELLNEPAWRLGKTTLQNYYERAYAIIRKQLGGDVLVIFSDAFRPRAWNRTLAQQPNVMIDIHLYQLFSRRDKRRSLRSHVQLAMRRSKLISRLQHRRPVMVGEWSLALPDGSIRLTDAVFRAYSALQQVSYSQADAWFFWSYKTEKGGPWSLRDSVKRGWLPDNFAE